MNPFANQLADCHTHLDMFDDAALPAILARARHAGVGLIIVAGVDLPSSRRAIRLAEAHAPLLAAVGLHPVYLPYAVAEADYAALRALALRHRKVVAISEIGLDYEEGRAPRPVQRDVFRRLVRLAVSLGRPIIFHDRGAHDDTFAILADEGAATVGAVMHYFAGDAATARRCLDLGGYLSVGKPIAKPEHGALREIVRDLPLDRLLLETDAYFRPDRGATGQTEPWQVSLVAAQVAAIKGLSVETVAQATWDNLTRLLGGRARAT